MNLVFIGSSGFGLRCLETCLGLPEVKVTGVITAPQTFAISYCPSGVTNVLHADMSELLNLHAIPVQRLERSMNETGLFEEVAKWNPDAFLVAGWYHMIPKRWRELAPAYGLHASLLPDYSGGAPLVWAMINGEPKTGITLFQMDDGVDSGAIAGQKEEPIYANDTIASLYARIEERGLELLREVLPQLASGTLELRLQDETKRRIVPQRSPEDGLIDWAMDASSIDRFIRAQTRPYPGAFTTLEGKPLHIWRAQVAVANNQLKTGCVDRMKESTYTVACGTGAIVVNEISYEKRTYTQAQLAEVFGGGGQRLGASPNCLNSSEPC
jgi:methionyl-tRNA formyltransferase